MNTVVNIQLVIFVVLAVFGSRYVLDDLIYTFKSAPKITRFSGIAHKIGYLMIIACIYFVLNDHKFW